MVKHALILMLATCLVGCGTLYRSDSKCPGYVENGGCRDLRETYEATHDFDRQVYRDRLRAQQEENEGTSRSRRARGGNQIGGSNTGDDQQYRIAGFVPLLKGEEHPRPILTQAIPVRVFVDPFEDEDGRLHTPGFIYVRATEPQWIFGGQETSDSRVVTPLVPTR